MRRLGAPRRIVNLVEGESLVNDAAALVAYRVAVAAAVAGTFSLLDASARVRRRRRRRRGARAGRRVRDQRDPPPARRPADRDHDRPRSPGYAAFLPAEHLHLSGVLAVVTAGLYLGWRPPSSPRRPRGCRRSRVWEVLTFLLNATLFVLIGLQLPVVVDGLDGRSLPELVGYAALVCAVVIGARFAWLFTTPYLDPGDRPATPAARARGWAPPPGGDRLERAAWRGVPGHRAGPARRDRRRRAAARAGPHRVRHVRRRAGHRRRPGPHPARPDPAARRGDRRAGGGARGAASPACTASKAALLELDDDGRRGLGRRRGARPRRASTTSSASVGTPPGPGRSRTTATRRQSTIRQQVLRRVLPSRAASDRRRSATPARSATRSCTASSGSSISRSPTSTSSRGAPLTASCSPRLRLGPARP